MVLWDSLGGQTSVSFDGSKEGQTVGKWIVSTGKSKTALLSRPTKGIQKSQCYIFTPFFFSGSQNAYPYVGKVVITEIMYDPPSSSPQYILIKNTGSTAVPLFSSDVSATPWKIKGVNFTFPAGQTLAAGQAAFVSLFQKK